MKAEKILVEFRSSEHNTLERRIKNLYPALQPIGKELSECSIDPSLIDLEALIRDPRTTLMAFLPEEFQAVAKFVSRGALQFPKDFDEAIQAVENAKLKIGADTVTFGSYYEIKSDGEIKPVLSKFTDLREQCTVYTANEIENKRLLLAREICDALHKHQELARELQVPQWSVYDTHHWGNLMNVISYDGNTFRPVTNFVKKQILK